MEWATVGTNCHSNWPDEPPESPSLGAADGTTTCVSEITNPIGCLTTMERVAFFGTKEVPALLYWMVRSTVSPISR